MTKIEKCFCVGTFKGVSKKTNKPFTIAYFTKAFDYTDKGCDGSLTFQTFDEHVEVGEEYECIFNGKGYTLINP